MSTDRTPSILIKAPPLDPTVQLRLGVVSTKLQVTPLFQHIPPERAGAFAAAGGGTIWQRLALETGDDGNLWDLCHALAGGEQGLGGQSAVFAEPDL